MPGGSGDYNSLLQAANRQLQPPRGVLTAPYGEQGVQVTMASAICGHSPGGSYPVKRLRVPLRRAHIHNPAPSGHARFY